MKKIFLLVLCLALSLTVIGCSLDSPPKKEKNGTEVSDEKGEMTFGLNEVAVFKNLKFTALEIKESSGSKYFAPEEGNTFVGVKFEIENTSEEEQSISTILLFDGYADDVKCDYSFSASCAFDEGTLDGTVAPGKKLVGWYAVELSEDWQQLELHVQSDFLSDKTAKFVFEK